MNRWLGWLKVHQPGRRSPFGDSALLLPDLILTLTSLGFSVPLDSQDTKAITVKKKNQDIELILGWIKQCQVDLVFIWNLGHPVLI